MFVEPGVVKYSLQQARKKSGANILFVQGKEIFTRFGLCPQ